MDDGGTEKKFNMWFGCSGNGNYDNWWRRAEALHLLVLRKLKNEWRHKQGAGVKEGLFNIYSRYKHKSICTFLLFWSKFLILDGILNLTSV